MTFLRRELERGERESSETTSDTIENYLTQIERGHCARDETIPSRPKAFMKQKLNYLSSIARETSTSLVNLDILNVGVHFRTKFHAWIFL